MQKEKTTFQLFDSRNTCTEIEREQSMQQASNMARKMSPEYHHVIVNTASGFEEYENGQLVYWSYPNGLGMIKINS